VAAQMPAILRPEQYDAWLSSNAQQARELLEPYPQSRIVCHPVAPYVNHLEFDEPRLIKPADR
jgi:putative SOS response-associated peptidase YedK